MYENEQDDKYVCFYSKNYFHALFVANIFSKMFTSIQIEDGQVMPRVSRLCKYLNLFTYVNQLFHFKKSNENGNLYKCSACICMCACIFTEKL